MKALKLLLSLAMLLLCSNMAASAEYKYVPLVQEGAQWEYYCQKTGFSHFPDNVIDEHFPFTINLEGDSILAGKTYKKCWLNFYDKYMHLTTETDRKLYDGRTRFLIALMREEDKRVYAVYQEDIKSFFNNYVFGSGSFNLKGDFFEWMIYDFNDIKSVLDMPYSHLKRTRDNAELLPDKEVTLEIDGAMRKGLKLDYRYRNVDGNIIVPETRSKDMYIIEGIGLVLTKMTVNIPDISLLFLCPQAIPLVIPKIGVTGLPLIITFNQMTLNGRVILRSDNYVEYGIDEPQTGVEGVESDTAQSADASYYNLMGQKVNPKNLTTGIYIHRGQKVHIKR